MRRNRLPRAWALPVVATIVALAIAPASRAALLFSDDFAYPNGPLVGNSGGTGWAPLSAWAYAIGTTGNTVTNPLPGTGGKSIQISSNSTLVSRPLSTTYASGGTSAYYISFGFNAAPFQGLNNGMYAGVAVYLNADPSNNLFMGMPGSSGAFGFDWTNRGDPSASASNNTNYLALYAITPGSGNTTSVTMYATTNLLMSGTALMSTTPWVSILDDLNFSFDSVNVSGAYGTGSIKFAGLAMADNPTDAVAFTQTAVPEPSSLFLGALPVALGAYAIGASRRKSSRATG